MNNIENYYYIIIGIGLFIMFALVGYLVEISKKNKEIEKNVQNNDFNINNDINNSNINNNNEIIENKSEEILIDDDILNK